MVVAPERHGASLGRDLVAAAGSLARDDGALELFLLTETAIDWFRRRGYVVVPRQEAAATVGQSVEFTTACPVTAVAMRLVRA